MPRTIRPTSAALKLTGRCNSRCVTCNFWRTAFPDAITAERARRLLVELRDLGIEGLELTGGEPLLCEELFEILGSCGEHWFKNVILATNGLLLERFADRINGSVITGVLVSLDGVGAANDRIRGVPGYYDRVMGALPRIRKPIAIRSLFTNRLVPDMEELLRVCRERGYAYRVGLLDLQAYCFSSKDTCRAMEALWPSPDDVTKGLDLLLRFGYIDRALSAEMQEYLTRRRFLFPHCITGYTSLYIQSSGAVRTGCNVFQPVGNILERDLRSIVDSAAYRASARRMFDLDCPLCSCGYGQSSAYHRPLHEIGPYVRRRMARLHPL